MAPVFAHGRLRLYLLKLLDESPRHGYEVIRLLGERFQGLYAPSAGTVYPRLAKLEKEGLVSHSTEGGRKVYALTDEGRAELAARADEIAGLEAEIRESVSTLAAEIREDVRGAAGDLRREVRAAAQQTRTVPEDVRNLRDAKQEWRERAQRAKEESRRAKEDARAARRQAKAARDAVDSARDEVQQIVRQVQEQVQSYSRGGDWQAGVREGLAELTRQLGQFGGAGRSGGPQQPRTAKDVPYEAGPPAAGTESDDSPPSADPMRDLERLLDRFRDDIRDAARDLGVDDGQLREVRRHLSAAAAHITAALHTGRG
ncbi:PadR family transcriptional regulator [Actinacidiphila bryophytorum]|uniref:Transcriptional regulator, PadR family n=1 Tax=Actinacidiphila bryophytorum TaxID=1436133 RepID=A0A9W4ECD3_9ACTN|nr:PadR family transcriptional regulator [Actinacidiphila bryophytorum]MBM9439773.1 helix-turn-helix transcriptional regulator [Actinacidiphila bryophytorum]MBN6544937.1 helix-turn-helix transcriptional regulator [Actinacidiphila bryophytorum]CAG7605255.1 Transcriptional regulator, PadR family [Actinacidiphila bryophytorum]